MNCITYYLRSEKYFRGNKKIWNSYGISAAIIEDGVLCVIDSVSNVSSDRIFVEKIVDLFNNLNLSHIHFRDALDNYLNM